MKGHIKHGKDVTAKPTGEQHSNKTLSLAPAMTHMLGMTAGNMLPPKPSHKDRKDDTVHSEVRASMADWVAGRKSTGEHKKVMKRAKGALSAKSIREGGY